MPLLEVLFVLVNAFVNNPNLKSEKTVDFELGFAQTLNLNSSLTLSTINNPTTRSCSTSSILGLSLQKNYLL